MDPWELEAREAIRTLIARYAHCADRGRFEELAALFAEDATLEIAGREPLRGREAIRAFLSATKTALAGQSTHPFIRHHVSSVLIDVQTPDAATAASYFFVITELGPDHWGRYHDDLARVGGRWLFRRRSVRLDGRWGE
jgi:uncharacterized protein (TIGR02246 family)